MQADENTILIREADGRLGGFDPGEMESVLRKAFEAAGYGDAYLSEDIAFAFEFALKQASGRGGQRIFSRREVDGMLPEILLNSGCGGVTEFLPDGSGSRAREAELETDGILMPELLRVHLNLDDAAADEVAARVRSALTQIGIPRARSGLFIQLAEYYLSRRNFAVPPSGRGVAGKTLRSGGPGAVSLTIRDGEHSCRRLTVALGACAAAEGWELPLTELISGGALTEFGRKLAHIPGMERTGLPLHAVVTGLAGAAPEVLGAPWPGARRTLCELLEWVWRGLGETPSRMMFKSGA